MRILTFNLRTSYAYGDGVNHWEKRKEACAETILNIRPDLAGLQEVDPTMWRTLEPALSDWHVLKGTAQTGDHENGNGLLVRKGSFEVLDSGRFWLSDTPGLESISFKQDWGPRILLWARLGSFIVAVTHFDTNQECWLPSARVVLEQLGRIAGGTPVFLMGDFNTRGGGPAWSEFQKAGFRDAWIETGGGEDVFTYHEFTGRTSQARAGLTGSFSVAHGNSRLA